MAKTPAYDLMVLIDPDAPDERRAQILADVKKQIDSGDGSLKGEADWGMRRLTFEIDHHPEAYYHLFQLEATSGLLDQLRHNLSIDDAVLRHRVIRLPAGAPETTPRPARQAPASEEGEPGQRPDRGRRGEQARPAEPSTAESPPAQPAESTEPAAASAPAEQTAPAAAEAGEPGSQPA